MQKLSQDSVRGESAGITTIMHGLSATVLTGVILHSQKKSSCDLIIYELHVRDFTHHPSSGVKHRGTFSGLMEKIPYLKELGINAVELMPIFEFDETMNSRTVDDKQLLECWGYNTVGFFAPNSSYAAANEHNQEGTEFKTLIRELHANGIEVILDVVFNHTAEGNEKGKTISFKGLDNNIYYMLTPDGNYYNFSGCGNTLNCNPSGCSAAHSGMFTLLDDQLSCRWFSF